MEYFDTHSFLVSTMGVIVSLVLLKFSLGVESNTLLRPLYNRTIVSS